MAADHDTLHTRNHEQAEVLISPGSHRRVGRRAPRPQSPTRFPRHPCGRHAKSSVCRVTCDAIAGVSSSKRASTTYDAVRAVPCVTEVACTIAATMCGSRSSGLWGALCRGGDDGRLELLLVRRLPRPAAAAHVGGVDARVHVSGRLKAVKRLPPEPPQVLHPWCAAHVRIRTTTTPSAVQAQMLEQRRRRQGSEQCRLPCDPSVCVPWFSVFPAALPAEERKLSSNMYKPPPGAEEPHQI